MKFAALVGVKDEVELIGPCVAHLREIGVDQIVVSDYGSTDGTLDILGDEQRIGDLTLESVDGATVADYDLWSVRERALAESTGADWVLFLDADEFWIPASGSLRDCRHLLDADVLSVDRFNVAVSARQQSLPVASWLERHAELPLYTTMAANLRKHVEDHPDVPFITLMPGHKVMARPHAIERVEPGSHDVSGSADAAIRRHAAQDLLIAHVFFSTAERFLRKLDNIRAELAQNPDCYDGDLAWHWKRWAAMSDDAIDREFALQMPDDAALSLLRDRAIVRSAQEIFVERLRLELSATEAELRSSEAERERLLLQLDIDGAERTQLRDGLAASEAETVRLHEALVASEAERTRLHEALVASEAERIRLRDELGILEDEQAQLEATINRIANSKGWRFLERLRGARQRLS